MSLTYEVRTFGCQMNVHDSERISGLLESAGYELAAEADPDVIVFNTCAVRENADNKLYGTLGMLLPKKEANPKLQIAVGGLLSPKRPGHHLGKSAVGRRGFWDSQHGCLACASGPCKAQRRGTN